MRDATNAPNSISGQKILKDTLSETLTRFYPLAGRVQNQDEYVINCNDKGIVFTTARVNNCAMTDFLSSGQPKVELLYQFLPTLPPVTKIGVDDGGVSGFKNGVYLLDGAKIGDIDAWVTLDQHEMDVLEANPEFLAFVSLNPPIMIST
ncbi:hypothetical protein RJ639_037770 [Escallonia herrerae]|uniref:Uncharacterized protein n=1 Tax=Escallonia herrerae TaxID=1293975 RepID=A0AA88WK97_9ASTE|nr:hypothetical protein RJ639_037770 [Escallonia herrerae]